ncbi:hypothetical protein NDU88_001368 [Pleurodeles waltl]|uniref:Uncharacterized protein n=1 Tax=Pleurodeles waltl TaxID=8319 RepID=A0AAV7V9E1_PLEWA|nr:hypothetical protein NDU88_001368 [Pleurodeles waltl]
MYLTLAAEALRLLVIGNSSGQRTRATVALHKIACFYTFHSVEWEQGCEMRSGAVIIFHFLVLCCAIDRFSRDRFTCQAPAPSYQEWTEAPLWCSVYGPCPSNSLGVLWTPRPRPYRKSPSLLGKVADTPDLDPNMATFIKRFSEDPKNGLDRAWKGCQDKLLDISGPLTKILELAVLAKESNTPLSPQTLLEWAQRAVCLLGNANYALSMERRRSFLMRIDPKLAELANG